MNGRPYGEERDRLARIHRNNMRLLNEQCSCDWCRIASLHEEVDRLNVLLASSPR